MQLGKKAGLKQSEYPLRNFFGDALLDLARSNPKVVVLDGDLGNSTKAEYVRNEFPERFFNIGIAESNLVGVGAGLAASGFYPFIVSFSSFLLCNAYDQIRLAVAMSNLDATIIGSHGGITLGKDGPTQMGIEDLALMGGLPTFTILVPSDPSSMHAAIKSAPNIKGPVFIRTSRVSMPFIYPLDDCPFEVGKANVVREGDDLTIVGCGMMVSAGLDAAAMLAEEGIEARVIDLHSIRPLDVEALAAAARDTGAIVCAEEHLLQGGMGSNVARIISEHHPVPMRFVGLKDVYVESGDPWDLVKKYNLTADDIANAGREVFQQRKVADMIHKALQQKEADGNPIRVGASAIEWMGSGLIAAISHVPGMEINVLANPDVKEGIQAFLDVGLSRDQIIEANTPAKVMDVVGAGKRAVTADPTLLAQVEAVDIVTDLTWSPAIGATVANSCIEHGKDVVLVNIEADVTVGHILKKKAAEASVLYTVSSGDEPGCLMEIYDFVKSIGYEVITIGKGKSNALNPAATPESVADSAKMADKDPVQVASYVDGTKTMFEMTCAANATGCRPMQRGMVGPETDINNVSEVFALEEDGGISKFAGNVDFVQGPSMSGGVFVTVRVEDQRIRDDLNYLKVGKGKYFTFFRPYHLWFLEAPISIAKAYLNREVWLEPLDEPVADVMTVAKRDLHPGDILERFGGVTHYGVMDVVEEARRINALPVGISPGAKVVRPVEAGSIVTWADVALDENSTVVRLRRQQDELFG